MKRASKVSVTILVSDAGRAKMDAVLKGLKAAGLGNASCQRAIGTITGEAAREDITRLRAVANVEAVELGGTFQLPPPDSPVQ